MADKNGIAVVDLWSSHEDRLQRLENDRVEMVAQVVEQTTTLKGIKEDIVDLAISTKETNKNMQLMMEKFQDHVQTDAVRLNALEKQEVREEKKIDWRRNILFAGLSGLGGAFLTYLAEFLKNH